jgi:hypothetical protein
MNTLSNALHDLLPLLGAISLIIGIKRKNFNYIIAALWLSLIALLLHYQIAGGELLGSYFGYQNAAIYTVNILILLITTLYLFFKLPLFQGKTFRYLTRFISAGLIVGSLLLLINLWINACFIENRRPGTPVLQIATFTPLGYCSHRYVFYRVGVDGKISYMCPDYYGIIPSVGHLEVLPDVVINHLIPHTKQK